MDNPPPPPSSALASAARRHRYPACLHHLAVPPRAHRLRPSRPRSLQRTSNSAPRARSRVSTCRRTQTQTHTRATTTAQQCAGYRGCSGGAGRGDTCPFLLGLVGGDRCAVSVRRRPGATRLFVGDLAMLVWYDTTAAAPVGAVFAILKETGGDRRMWECRACVRCLARSGRCALRDWPRCSAR